MAGKRGTVNRLSIDQEPYITSSNSGCDLAAFDSTKAMFFPDASSSVREAISSRITPSLVVAQLPANAH
jgi:hypothetical protein